MLLKHDDDNSRLRKYGREKYSFIHASNEFNTPPINNEIVLA
jgi:hypothetical protein